MPLNDAFLFMIVHQKYHKMCAPHNNMTYCNKYGVPKFPNFSKF